MTITDKQINDPVNWLEKAITENYIKYYNYADFTNMKEINNGSVGNIYQANWKRSDTLLIIKSSYKLTVKEILNEVFIYVFYQIVRYDITIYPTKLRSC